MKSLKPRLTCKEDDIQMIQLESTEVLVMEPPDLFHSQDVPGGCVRQYFIEEFRWKLFHEL